MKLTELIIIFNLNKKILYTFINDWQRSERLLIKMVEGIWSQQDTLIFYTIDPGVFY